MSQYIFNGIPSNNPLNTAVRDPVQLTFAQRAPTLQDNTYPLGSEWQNTVNGNVYKLISITFNNLTKNADANWVILSSSTVTTPADSFQVDTVTPPGVNPVLPTAAGLVKIFGQSVPNTSGIQVQSNALNEIDIAMFSPFSGGDFTFQRTDAGPSDETLVVTHAGTPGVNNNASVAIFTPNGGGDPSVRLSITGIQEYPIGIQHANNNFVIGTSAGTPTTTLVAWRLIPPGIITTPLQPSFLAVLTTSATNATGSGGVYNFGTNGTGVATVSFDQGMNVTQPAGILTFTAPVGGTGVYYFAAQMQFSNLPATTAGGLVIVAGTRSFTGDQYNWNAIKTAGGLISPKVSCIVNLAAGETVVFKAILQNGAGNTATVDGSAATVPVSWVEGCKLA